MRDVITHGYFGVEPIFVWRVKENELPDLKIKIENILLELQNQISFKPQNDDDGQEG